MCISQDTRNEQKIATFLRGFSARAQRASGHGVQAPGGHPCRSSGGLGTRLEWGKGRAGQGKLTGVLIRGGEEQGRAGIWPEAAGSGLLHGSGSGDGGATGSGKTESSRRGDRRGGAGLVRRPTKVANWSGEGQWRRCLSWMSSRPRGCCSFATRGGAAQARESRGGARRGAGA
jgi:hypothetical protein